MAGKEGLVLDSLDLNGGPQAPANLYSPAVLTDTPALYWRLGESVGSTAADTSGNARTGTYGAGVTLAQTGAIVGDTDTAVSLNNTSNGKITSSYSPFAGDFTVEGWFNRTASADSDVMWGASGTAGPFLRVDSASTGVTFDNDGTSGAGALTWAAAWPGNSQWVHCVFTFNSSTFVGELFINSVSQGTKTFAAIGASPGNFQVGMRATSTDPWNGLADEVAIYTSVLSSARILAHYNAGLGLGGTIAGAFILQGLDCPPPAKRQEWAQGADIDGGLLVRDPLCDNREVTVRLRIAKQLTMDLALTQISLISKKLEEAEQQPDGLALVWTPAGSTKTFTFYVLSGFIEDLPIVMGGEDHGWFLSAPVITVRMQCKPFGYGTPQTYSTSSSATPFVTMTLGTVAGDVPAEGRLLVTDAATQTRRYVEWGLEQRYYDPATSLLLDSDNMVTSGYTGFTTTRAGAYPGGTVIRGTLADVPTALMSSGTLSHVGAFRVKARVYAGTVGEYVRLAWQEGDGPYRANPYVQPPVGGTFTEVDLGLVTIPPKQLGTQRWQGRIEGYTTTSPGTDTIDVDYVVLVPAGEGYGKIRADAVTSDTSTVRVGRDLFNQTSGNLSGKTASIGGNWTTAGATTDFSVSGSGNVTRATNSDASRRFATLGASSTDIAVACKMQRSSTSGLATQRSGVLARYVDTSNYCEAVLLDGALVINVVVGGSVVASTTTASLIAGSTDNHIVKLVVSAAGQASATLTDTGGLVLTSCLLAHSSLATGGTLATGVAGIVDSNPSATITTRTYDDFTAWSPTIPVAIYSGRVAEIRYDGAIRQDSTGTYYGPAPAYRGSRFLVPPAGDENRTSRILVKAHRNDIEAELSGNVTDNLTIQAIVTPRYLVVPF